MSGTGESDAKTSQCTHAWTTMSYIASVFRVGNADYSGGMVVTKAYNDKGTSSDESTPMPMPTSGHCPTIPV